MTQQFIITIIRALALVAVVTGGVGMLLCVPYIIGTNILWIVAASIVALIGAILFASGEITLAYLYSNPVDEK